MDNRHVLVIGSAGIDIKGRPWEEVKWETPNIGRVRNSVGGVARNIAENLARLEISTVLLTAVGDDTEGKRVLRLCEGVGINCSFVQRVPDARTSTYMALLYPDGQLHVAIGDFEIISNVDTAYILEHEYLFQDAALVVIDCTLPENTLSTIFELANRYQVRVAADPTTPALAGRLCPYLGQLYMVIPNASETMSLCGLAQAAHDRESAISVARNLISTGVKIAVVTLGKDGLAYAYGAGNGFIRAIPAEVVDSTGAGDAFSGAAIFGLLNDVPIDEAMRLGITAASLTVSSRYTVLPELSQELLYDELMA